MKDNKIALLKKKRVCLHDLKDGEYYHRISDFLEGQDYQKIARGVEYYGYYSPILVTNDLIIIDGHKMRTVLMDLGYKECDCIVFDVSKETAATLFAELNGCVDEGCQMEINDILKNLTLGDFSF